jgi:hypothetical protein
MLRALLVGFVIRTCATVVAQPQWELLLPLNNDIPVVLDAMVASGTEVFMIATDASPDYSAMCRVDLNTGMVLSTEYFSIAGASTGPSLFVSSTPDEILLTGTWRPWPISAADSMRPAFFRTDATLQPIAATYGGLGGKQIGYSSSYQDSDGNIRMAYQCLVDDANPQQFKAVTFSPQGAVLDSAFLQETFSFPTLGSLQPLLNGNSVLLTSACLWGLQTVSQTMLVELDDAWGIEQVSPVPLANPNFQSGLSALGWPLYSVMLPSGNLVASGQYWRSFSNDRGAALQRLTPNGDLLGQWEADSPYDMDIPAWISGVDLGPDGNLYYAQLNNWTLGGPENPVPSQVQLFKLDTSFNVLGSYLIDGLADSTFYYPSVVKATPDGGLVVGGSRKDLSVPNAPMVAWLAKFGPEDLVSVPEWQSPLLGVYPNPGSDGFTAKFMRPLPGAMLQVFDTRGVLVHAQAVSDLQQVMAMGDQPSGIYVIHLRDAEGAFVSCVRWVKH